MGPLRRRPQRRGPSYSKAVENAWRGDSLFGQNLHTKGYSTLSLDTPDTENVIGSASYLFYRTATLPLAGVTRAQVESAYRRTYLQPAG